MSPAKKRILVVDDDPRWLQRIEDILIDEYEVVPCSSDDEAIASLKEQPFSLALLDMKLANGVSGLDLFERLQELAPNLPAVMLTGYPEPGSMRDSFKKGVLDYLEKGSDNLESELKTVIGDMLARIVTVDIMILIAEGEGKELEFKSTARWDRRSNKVNKELEKVIIKTIAGFLNSETGGTLLIGVDDTGNIIGIEDDWNTLSRKDIDGYEAYLTNLLLNALGKDVSFSLAISFHEVQQKVVCQISARPSPRAVWVSDDKVEDLYLRTGNSTRLLTTREAVEYCKVRWKE
jgi:ActR/RegA family two-component response regulator